MELSLYCRNSIFRKGHSCDDCYANLLHRKGKISPPPSHKFRFYKMSHETLHLSTLWKYYYVLQYLYETENEHSFFFQIICS